MKILFTICGRAGSKGIKNKNIKTFLGLSLPLYTLSAIDLYLKKNSDIIGDIVLNTDSQELINIFEKNRIRHVDIIFRDEKLAGDNVSKIAVIRTCYEEMNVRKNYLYDVVIDLDITSPLRTVADIENLVSTQISKGCDVTFSVTGARRNPYFNMVKKSECGYQRVISTNLVTRQSAPQVYDMNASLYAYKPDFLKKEKEIFDGYCEIIEMYDTGILDLDHEGDFELMEVIADLLLKKNKNLSEIYDNTNLF